MTRFRGNQFLRAAARQKSFPPNIPLLDKMVHRTMHAPQSGAHTLCAPFSCWCPSRTRMSSGWDFLFVLVFRFVFLTGNWALFLHFCRKCKIQGDSLGHDFTFPFLLAKNMAQNFTSIFPGHGRSSVCSVVQWWRSERKAKRKKNRVPTQPRSCDLEEKFL